MNLKHYDEIINSEFMDDDFFSIKLVEYYKEYVNKLNLNDLKDKERADELDKAVYRYADDYLFSKQLCSSIKTDSILDKNFCKYIEQFFDYLIHFSNEYEQNLKTFISQTRWI